MEKRTDCGPPPQSAKHWQIMLILGIETSCDDTGVALYDTALGLHDGSTPRAGLLEGCTPRAGLRAHALHSQVALHDEYGGVVPELASRDHIRRLLPLMRAVMARGGARFEDLSAVAYTQGPGLAGALLVGASVAASLAFGLGVPAIGVHHLEGHLLSPLLANHPPAPPFIALLVSGGHTQLMRVSGLREYALLGETQDDAAGEAFDKTAKLLGLGYPGGAALARLAQGGRAGRFRFPRPMITSGDLDFSFSGLKTAVATLCAQHILDETLRADIAHAFEEAVVDVLVTKCAAAMKQTGMQRLVVAGGVGANLNLRAALDRAGARAGFDVHYPPLEFCTDNGAMIALAGALHLSAALRDSPSGALHLSAALRDSPSGALHSGASHAFTVRPRWELGEIVKRQG